MGGTRTINLDTRGGVEAVIIGATRGPYFEALILQQLQLQLHGGF